MVSAAGVIQSIDITEKVLTIITMAVTMPWLLFRVCQIHNKMKHHKPGETHVSE